MKMEPEANLTDGTAVDKPGDEQRGGLVLDPKPTAENVNDTPTLRTESDTDEGESNMSLKRMDKIEILEKLTSLHQSNMNGTSNSCGEESLAGGCKVDLSTDEDKTISGSATPTRGGGDADDGSISIDSSDNSEASTALQSVLPSEEAKSSGNSGAPPLRGCMSDGQNLKQNRVYFSGSAISLKSSEAKKSLCKARSSSSSGLKSLTPFPRFNKSKKAETEGEIGRQQISGLLKSDEVLTSSMSNLELQVPETNFNFPIPVSSKHETIKQLAATLSPKSIKSKQLETKFQQTIRLRYFDYEAQRASEDWKFRKGTEALDLEYQRKFLSLMETHNSCKEKLHEKFIKQVKKTEKKLKKVAQQGRLNEGSCFNVSHNISSFQINKY